MSDTCPTQPLPLFLGKLGALPQLRFLHLAPSRGLPHVLPGHRKWLTTGKVMSVSVAQNHHGLAIVDCAEMKQLNETELRFKS